VRHHLKYTHYLNFYPRNTYFDTSEKCDHYEQDGPIMLTLEKKSNPMNMTLFIETMFITNILITIVAIHVTGY